jgi:hypothetical protein
LRFLGLILRVLRLRISVYNVYVTNHLEVTVCSKEENFCPNYVLEFGLWTNNQRTQEIVEKL